METRNTILVIFFIISELKSVYCTSNCKQFGLQKEYLNKRLKSQSLAEIVVQGHHGCARECMPSTACMSIDFYRPDNKCKLNDVDSTTADSDEFESITGSLFSDISEWPYEMFGVCGSRPCSDKQKCYESSASYSCVDIECDTSLVGIPNGSIVPDFNHVFFRDNATVVCHEGFLSNKANVTCMIVGKWESATCIKVTNVALGMQATMSSRYNKNRGPAKAVDGDLKSFFQTLKGQNEWQRVDLGAVFLIVNVHVYNIWDRYQARANGMGFKVGKKLDSMIVMGMVENFQHYHEIIDLPERTVGRYVELGINNGENFHLSEVQIMGIPV